MFALKMYLMIKKKLHAIVTKTKVGILQLKLGNKKLINVFLTQIEF